MREFARDWSLVDTRARSAIERAADAIIADVRERGDAAVLDYTRRFDRLDGRATSPTSRSRRTRCGAALESLPRATARRARDRRRAHPRFHRDQYERLMRATGRTPRPTARAPASASTPLDRVGLYVPGGKAAYPSSVLMNAIPAQVAGVRELVMVVPTPGGDTQSAGAGRRLPRRRRRGLHHRRRAGGGGARVRHRDRAGGRQDRRAGQRLRRRRQAPSVRHRRHRHDRRSDRDPGDCRRVGAPGLGRDGPVLAGRARRTGAGAAAVAGRGVPRCGRRGDRPAAAGTAAARDHRGVARATAARWCVARDLEEAARWPTGSRRSTWRS